MRSSSGGRLGSRAAELRQWCRPAAALASLTCAVLFAFKQFLTPALWYDEQWRALQISVPRGFWRDLNHAVGGASSFGWMGIERLVADLFGSREVVLRLPNFVALFFLGLTTYALARRFVPRGGALAVAGVVSLNTPMLAYGLQLKPYVMEAAAAAATVGLWLAAQEAPGRLVEGRNPHRLSAPRLLQLLLPYYGGMAVLVLIGTPVLFLLPGLLGYDVVRARRRERRERIVRWALATAVGMVGALHYLVFLRPQIRTIGDSYWAPAYLPVHGGLSAMARFLTTESVWFPRMLTSAGLLPPDTFYPGLRDLSLSQQVMPMLTLLAGVAAAVLLVMGTVSALQSHELRPFAVALVLALAIQLTASSRGAWPFGANRTNLFLVPLLAVLAAGGLTVAFRSARRNAFALVGAGALSVALLGLVPLQVMRLAQLRQDGNGSGMYFGMAGAVADVRAKARATDVVVLADTAPLGSANFAGWLYFMYDYEGMPAPARRRPPIARSNSLFLQGLPSDKLAAFLAGHPSSQRVYLFELWNFGTSDLYPESVAQLRNLGWCPVHQAPVPATGLMIELERSC